MYVSMNRSFKTRLCAQRVTSPHFLLLSCIIQLRHSIFRRELSRSNDRRRHAHVGGNLTDKLHLATMQQHDRAPLHLELFRGYWYYPDPFQLSLFLRSFQLPPTLSASPHSTLLISLSLENNLVLSTLHQSDAIDIKALRKKMWFGMFSLCFSRSTFSSTPNRDIMVTTAISCQSNSSCTHRMCLPICAPLRCHIVQPVCQQDDQRLDR